MSTQSNESTLLTETDAPDEELDRDDVFHILQCRRRRLVLKYLQEHDGAADMRDITERIAAIENDKTVAKLHSQERQRVYIALYQSHLPKLDRDGIIEYEQNRGVVRRTERTAEFDPYLINEPELLSDADGTENAPVERDGEGGPVERDGEDSVQATDDGDWKSQSLAAAGGSLTLAMSIYADAISLPASVAIVAVFACVLFAALAVNRSQRGPDTGMNA